MSRERPILFSSPMVRAILEGRKTQTRRAVKQQPGYEPQLGSMYSFPAKGGGFWLWPNALPQIMAECPYGYIGDRLWVKERWRPSVLTGVGDVVGVEYRADNQWKRFSYDEFGDDWKMPKAAFSGDVTPLFMPRWASRITLEITDVRVERLQDISDEDCIAEGVERRVVGEGWREYGLNPEDEAAGTPPMRTAKDSYRSLWNSINGEGSWDKNPWVWAVSFRRLEVR